MKEGARILQPLICNTLAGGKNLGGQEYYGTPAFHTVMICIYNSSTGKTLVVVNCKNTFEGVYHFTYEWDLGGGGICDSDRSNVIACQEPGSPYVDNEVFYMNYGKCPEVSTSANYREFAMSDLNFKFLFSSLNLKSSECDMLTNFISYVRFTRI